MRKITPYTCYFRSPLRSLLRPLIRYFVRSLMGLCLMVLTACAPSIPGVNIQTLSLLSRDGANDNLPLSVDFVVVYDQELLKKLKTMTAKQYFASIDQLRRDNMSMLDVWRWEMIPGQFLGNYTPSFKSSNAWGGFFFADYQKPGEHRFSVGSAPHICVVLGTETIEAVIPRDDLKKASPSQPIASYPLDQTVLLNTHTPNVGTSHQDYQNLKAQGGVENGAQKLAQPGYGAQTGSS